MSLSGKVAIITGASSGIGAETCVHFVENGAQVAAVGRNLENLKRTANNCSKANPSVKCLLIQADVTKDAKKIVDKTLAEFGKIDVLVNIAGILENGGILDIDLDTFDTVLNTNLRSVFQLTKLVLPHLISSKGNVVSVSSQACVRSMKFALSFGVSKAALDQFTKCVALEVAAKNVRVNSVNPGMIVSDVNQPAAVVDDETYNEFVKQIRSTHALERTGHVSEVAAAIVFLASDSASFITGALLPIDGGKHAVCPQ